MRVTRPLSTPGMEGFCTLPGTPAQATSSFGSAARRASATLSTAALDAAATSTCCPAKRVGFRFPSRVGFWWWLPRCLVCCGPRSGLHEATDVFECDNMDLRLSPDRCGHKQPDFLPRFVLQAQHPTRGKQGALTTEQPGRIFLN